MKTVKKNSEFKRVDNTEAIKLVSAGWEYASKSEWKSATRKPREEKPEKEAKKKNSDKK